METSVKMEFVSGGAYCFGALVFRLARQIGMNTVVERVQGGAL